MDIRKVLFNIYWKIEEVISPKLKHSQHLYENILNSFVSNNTNWLDLGCGHQILPVWRSKGEKPLAEKCKMIVGIDYDLPSLKNHKNIFLKVRGDIRALPFKDNFFNLITANMVVEHLASPDVQFKEVCRILKPGGIFLIHTPNALGYTTIIGKIVPSMLKHKLIYLFQGRKEEDVFDTHYKANTRMRINNLAKETGFDVAKIKMIVSSAQFVIIPPLAVFELIWIRILMMKRLKSVRPYIIAILKKNNNECGIG